MRSFGIFIEKLIYIKADIKSTESSCIYLQNQNRFAKCYTRSPVLVWLLEFLKYEPMPGKKLSTMTSLTCHSFWSENPHAHVFGYLKLVLIFKIEYNIYCSVWQINPRTLITLHTVLKTRKYNLKVYIFRCGRGRFKQCCTVGVHYTLGGYALP